MLYPAEEVGAVPKPETFTVASGSTIEIVVAGLGADSSSTEPNVLTYVYTYTRSSCNVPVPPTLAKVGATVGAGTPILQLLDATLFCSYLLCALLMVGFVVAVSLSRRIGWNDAAFGALVGAFPNTGFMGVPLLVALLGAAAAGPAIVTILVDLIVTTSLCIALSRLDGADEHGARKAARNALKGVLTNPMPWAIVMGAVASGLGFRLIEPIEKTVALLADSASPVALFTIGAVLARSQISAKETQHTPILWRDVLPTVFFKLVLHPVLVLLVLSAAIQQGFHVERFTLIVVVLVAALPSASNVAVLTERFGANTGRIAKIILLSTAIAFFTFSGAVALLVDN